MRQHPLPPLHTHCTHFCTRCPPHSTAAAFKQQKKRGPVAARLRTRTARLYCTPHLPPTWRGAPADITSRHSPPPAAATWRLNSSGSDRLVGGLAMVLLGLPSQFLYHFSFFYHRTETTFRYAILESTTAAPGRVPVARWQQHRAPPLGRYSHCCHCVGRVFYSIAPADASARLPHAWQAYSARARATPPTTSTLHAPTSAGNAMVTVGGSFHLWWTDIPLRLVLLLWD